MGMLVMDCPYDGCSARHTTFHVATCHIHKEEQSGFFYHWATLCCPICHNAVMAKLVSPSNGHGLTQHPSDISKIPGISVIETFPKKRSGDAPEFVDANVARTFERGNGAISRGEAETAGMLLRKMLDTVLSDKFPHTGNGMLGQKMAKLVPNVDLPTAMVDWALEVKDYGNVASHESHDPDIEEIKELRDFAELLLTYVYTLPQRLQQMRSPTI